MEGQFPFSSLKLSPVLGFLGRSSNVGVGPRSIYAPSHPIPAVRFSSPPPPLPSRDLVCEIDAPRARAKEFTGCGARTDGAGIFGDSVRRKPLRLVDRRPRARAWPRGAWGLDDRKPGWGRNAKGGGGDLFRFGDRSSDSTVADYLIKGVGEEKKGMDGRGNPGNPMLTWDGPGGSRDGAVRHGPSV
ncbi:hypothetical protein NL676_016468 [Syzygium grande]|nr:hypothetical protein NL676_016468 [Syzygium grande]